MTPTQAGRLRDLHALMLNFPKEHLFDLHQYISGGTEITCDTTCCAAGWGAALLPSWQKHVELSCNRGVIIEKESSTLVDPVHRFNTPKTLQALLGIDNDDFEFMFYGTGYAGEAGTYWNDDDEINWSSITPLHVAAHIETVLTNYEYKGAI